MASADEFIESAASYIGVSGTDNMFNTWYWGRHVFDPNTYPWCAAFQSYIGVHNLKMPFKPSASAAGVAWQGTQIPDSEARKGDWVLFNWDGRQDFGWADHIGVVEWFDHSTGWFGTIEGNTGYGEGQVLRVNRNNNGSYATKFFRPPYDEETKEEIVAATKVNVPAKGTDVHRLYRPGTGEHFYTVNILEKDLLTENGWVYEGVAWKCPDPQVPVYRLYQAGRKHIFTASFAEAYDLSLNGWTPEGVDFFASIEGTPIYRVYNRNTSDHLLTANENEVEQLVKAGWVNEGTAFLV